VKYDGLEFNINVVINNVINLLKFLDHINNHDGLSNKIAVNIISNFVVYAIMRSTYLC
jgi:hypothetical protein